MKLAGFVLIFLLSACATIPSPEERRAHADALAHERGWRAEKLSVGGFDLVTFHPKQQAFADVLSIYIEGDGFAWIDGSRPSSDPTPRDPLALRLALAQPDGQAVYLARPCQYVDAESRGCAERYWTEARFAPEVIAATSEAVALLKQRYRARNLVLIGYSGGGAVAALVAARRQDVVGLVTVAGNLDHRAWTNAHHVIALSGSLNPADEIQPLETIFQWHFVGEKDSVIPPPLVEQFAKRFPAGSTPVVQIVPRFDHHCCWVEEWSRLWRLTAVENRTITGHIQPE